MFFVTQLILLSIIGHPFVAIGNRRLDLTGRATGKFKAALPNKKRPRTSNEGRKGRQKSKPDAHTLVMSTTRKVLTQYSPVM